MIKAGARWGKHSALSTTIREAEMLRDLPRQVEERSGGLLGRVLSKATGAGLRIPRFVPWRTPARGSRSLCETARSAAAICLVMTMGMALPASITFEGPLHAAQTVAGSPALRYLVPPTILEKPFKFCGEVIPLSRIDVRSRVETQINFLLMDARSVLTEWLKDRARYSWILEENLGKEGLPKEFALLSPVIAGLNILATTRGPGVGWWALTSQCTAAEGCEMSVDSWHDDRMDLELSTRCFAARIKGIRKELNGQSWLNCVAAYLSNTKTLLELQQRWNTAVFWDLPLPENAEEYVIRWIALEIIDTNRSFYGLHFKESPPLMFDQVSGLSLAKDLPVAEIARITGTPAREILLLNPKVKPSPAVFPAMVNGHRLVHKLAAPQGKGQLLVKQLHQKGYLADNAKR